jgi:septal ring factor EnvC (AmiA/AmiB activator)
MSSDDLTRNIADNEVANTQPTITAVFRLLNEVKVQGENVNARLDAIDSRLDAIDSRLDAIDSRLDAFNARLDEVESRLARDIEGVNTRVIEGFRELSNKIDALNRSRLQTEADYLGLRQRVTDLESKAS